MIETSTIEAVQEEGEMHLENHHRSQLESKFVDRFGGEQCRNGCDYEFPVGVDEVAGYECPECEYDHFSALVEQYLYWQIEVK